MRRLFGLEVGHDALERRINRGALFVIHDGEAGHDARLPCAQAIPPVGATVDLLGYRAGRLSREFCEQPAGQANAL